MPDEAPKPAAKPKAAKAADAPEFDARAEILKLHRGLEYLANQLNMKLPG